MTKSINLNFDNDNQLIAMLTYGNITPDALKITKGYNNTMKISVMSNNQSIFHWDVTGLENGETVTIDNLMINIRDLNG